MRLDADSIWSEMKLHFGILALALIFTGWLLTSHWAALQPSYTTFVGAVTTVVALFFGANVGAKLVDSNHVAKMAKIEAGAGPEEKQS